MDLEKHLDNLYKTCYKCQVFHKLPKDLTQQETKTEVSGPHECFHADVIKRAGQIILLITDHFSSLANAIIIDSEKSEHLKHGLITLTPTMRKPDWISIKVDNAPGFQSLVKSEDKELQDLKIKLTLTEEMNKNSNAVVDKRCQELEEELKKLSPEGSRLSQAQLTKSVMNLNRRLRRKGSISAFEIHTSRDINTGLNLDLDDTVLRGNQVGRRNKDNQKTVTSHEEILIGDTVTLRNNSDKHTVRDMFIVTGKEGEDVKVQKVLHPLISGAGKFMGKVYTTHEKRLKMVNRPDPVSIVADSEESCDNILETSEKENTLPDEKPAVNMLNYWNPINQDFHNGAEDDEDAAHDNTVARAPPEINLITFEEVPRREDLQNPEIDLIEEPFNIREEENAEVQIQTCPFDLIDDANGNEVPDGDDGSIEEGGDAIEGQHAAKADQVQVVQDVDFQAVVFQQVPVNVGSAQVQRKLKRSAPVKKKSEHWVVRSKGPKEIRKSRRLASIKCRERIKTIAAQYDNDEFEDIVLDDQTNDVQQADDHNELAEEHPPVIPQIDGNYTLYDRDVFSAADIAYLSSEILRHAPERAYSLAQQLHLEVPTHGVLSRNHVYLLPPDHNLTRLRVFSTSDGNLSQISTPVHRPSAWRRQLRRLRGFLDRMRILPGRS